MIEVNKLVDDFCNADIDAHKFFYRLYFDELHRFAHALTNDMEEIIKLVQESVIRVWYRDNSDLQSEVDVKALHFRTVKYACSEYNRHKRSEAYIAFRKRIEHFCETGFGLADGAQFSVLQQADQQTMKVVRAALRLTLSSSTSENAIAAELRMSVGEITHKLIMAKCAVHIILSDYD